MKQNQNKKIKINRGFKPSRQKRNELDPSTGNLVKIVDRKSEQNS